MQGGLPGRRQQRSVLLYFHCISTLVGGVSLRESVMWRCSLNLRCTPTGLCHSLHVRAAAALSVCSHSICIYLVLSALCPAENPGICPAPGIQTAPLWHSPNLPGYSRK